MLLAEQEYYREFQYEIWREPATNSYYFYVKTLRGNQIYASEQPASFITTARIYAKQYIDDVITTIK